MMKNLIFCLCFIFVLPLVNAQDNYTLKMTIKVEGLPPEYAAYGEQEITTYVKGEKTKTEMNSMMGSVISYFDGKVQTTLTDMMGNKTGYKATKEELEAAESKDKTEKPKITYTSEKKMIAGYECTKAIVTTLDKDKKEEVVIVWFTEKIKSVPSGGRAGSSKRTGMDFGDIKGQPLAFEASKKSAEGVEMKIVMTTTEVSTATLSDSVFVPATEDYTMMSFKDYMEKMKSMGGR